jgi:hypothetical protein
MQQEIETGFFIDRLLAVQRQGPRVKRSSTFHYLFTFPALSFGVSYAHLTFLSLFILVVVALFCADLTCDEPSTPANATGLPVLWVRPILMPALCLACLAMLFLAPAFSLALWIATGVKMAAALVSFLVDHRLYCFSFTCLN